MKKLLLYNEMEWLASVNCNIKENANGIYVVKRELATTDFNFFIPVRHIDVSICNRISDLHERYHELITKLLQYKMRIEGTYDINFVTFGENKKNTKSNYSLKTIAYNTWENGSRKLSSNTKFYYIYYNKTQIGKMSTIENDSIVGIYDFEIIENYRHMQHAANFLRHYIETADKLIFLQTWSTNYSAIRSYISAGFNVYEHLYRYNP